MRLHLNPILLHLEAVTSTYNLKGLRQHFDAVESNVRGLKALGVSASSYGGLLSPILMSRLSSELRLIISRELTEEEWDIEVVMEILQREIEARERSAGATSPLAKKPTSQRPPPTALSLTTGASPKECPLALGHSSEEDIQQVKGAPHIVKLSHTLRLFARDHSGLWRLCLWSWGSSVPQDARRI